MHRVEQQLKGFETCEQRVDVCVVGGGLTGLCAAIAAARGGAKTVLIHHRLCEEMRTESELCTCSY